LEEETKALLKGKQENSLSEIAAPFQIDYFLLPQLVFSLKLSTFRQKVKQTSYSKW